jgi:hypothetical protein
LAALVTSGMTEARTRRLGAFRRAAAMAVAAGTVAAVPAAYAAGNGTTAHGYRHYTNARFGFSVQRPAGFTAQPPPENGDGRQWTTDGGRVSLTAYGANNVNRLTPREQAAADARGVRVVYRNISGTVVTVSGYTHGGRVIVYRRDVVGAGSIDTLAWAYPASQKRRWDQAIATTARTFRPGDVTHAH